MKLDLLRSRVAAVFILAVTFCSGCTVESDSLPAEDDRVIRAQLDSLWAGVSAAMTAADTAALAAFYADSAYFAETGLPTARGRAAIVSATAGVFECCSYIGSQQDIERTDIAGDIAVQFGTYRDVIQPTGQAPIAFYGRFDAVLTRDSTGPWRISRLVVIRDSSTVLSTNGR